MKRIFPFLIACSFLLAFSIPSFAASSVAPSSLNFIHEVNGYYEFNIPVDLSGFDREIFKFWNDFLDVYNNESSDLIPFIGLSAPDQSSCYFTLLDPGSYYLGNYSTYHDNILTNNSFTNPYVLVINLSDGSLSFLLKNTSFHFSYLLSDSNLFCKNLSSYNPSKLNYFMSVNWDNKPLKIVSQNNPSFIYTLSIQYQYEDGSQALESYNNTFEEFESFSIPTPKIPGYSPSIDVVSGQMFFDRDFIVIFKKDESIEPSFPIDVPSKGKYSVLNSDAVSDSLTLFCNNFKPTLTSGLCIMFLSVGVFVFLKAFRNFVS